MSQFRNMIEEVTTTGILVRHNNLPIQSGDYVSLDKNSYVELNLLAD